MTWKRYGKCNRCGYCCTFLGPAAMTVRSPQKPLDTEMWRIRGAVRVTEHEANFVSHTYWPCPKVDKPRLMPDGTKACCTIYDDRPESCKTHPFDPCQVEGTPCAYWFEDEQGNKRGGGSSPYPTAAQLRFT